MHRPAVALTLTLALTVASGIASAAAQDEGPGTDTVWDDHSLVVIAAAPGTLALTDTPGAPYTGPRIYCAWFSVEVISTGVDLVGITDPTVGDTYVFNCWFTGPWIDPHPGYPIVAVYDLVSDPPGPVITTPEVSRFAVDSIDFEPPAAAISPSTTHVVGVESWFAVDSRVDYEPASAQAGPVWATVRPEFRDVTWDFGNGDQIVCTDDALTQWSPDGPADQSSDCTYSYRSSPDGDGEAFAVSATAHWTVWQQTDRTNGQWTVWGTIGLTTALPVEVAQLQAAINS